MHIFRRLRPSLGLALSCGLLALACGPGESPRLAAPPPALRDPQVVAVDGFAPSNGLDGQGSLFLGDGWGRPEGDGKHPDWGSMAWVVGREAVVHLLLPPGAEMDFFARVLPYPWAAGSPLQEVELLAGDRLAGRAELVRDWQNIRIPLPAGLPGNRILTLRLRFRHALKPAEGDPRSLAAAFSQLALVPRGVGDPAAFLAAHTYDPVTGRVVLPAGGALRLPLPPASRVDVRLALRSLCQDCRVSLELTGPGPAVRTVQAAHEGAQTLSARFDTAPAGFQNLWIRATPPPSPRSVETVELTLEEVGVQARLRDGSQAPPHVFVYMIDTLRADMLAAYGGRPELTPHMNAFADEAVTYLQARASSTWTLPSVVSLLTGLYPDRHAVTEGLLEYDANRLRSLPQWLGERGYSTVGISHSFIISPVYGLDRGFGSFYYHDYLNAHALGSQEARNVLTSWLAEQQDGRPLFAYIHTVDPHAPYAPPERFRQAVTGPALAAHEEGLPNVLLARGQEADKAAVAHLRALYEGEVRATDQELGRFVDLLKWLGLWDRSYVLLVGDHGEEFAEHGGLEHGTTVFEEALRVPLIVKYPGGRWSGTRINRSVSLVDVAPTLLAEIAPGAAQDLDGQVLPGPETTGREQPAYFAVAPLRVEQAPVNLRGLALEGRKCIENLAGVDPAGHPAPRLLAFDLAADPGEQRPLTAGAVEDCRKLLEAWDQARARYPKERSERPVTPETLERLRALGYIR